MIPSYFLIGYLTVVLAVVVIATSPDERSQMITKCEDQCKKIFESVDNKKFAKNLKACHYGCRILSINDASFSINDGTDDAKTECESDCMSTHYIESDQSACRSGCGFKISVLESKDMQPQYSNPMGFFNSIKLPQFRVVVPMSMNNLMSRINNMLPNFSSSSLENIFSKIHNNMNNMLKSLTDENQRKLQGTGRLVVINSGPGYRHEKTYNFGPDGTKVEIDGTKVKETLEDEEEEEEEDLSSDLLLAPKVESFDNYKNELRKEIVKESKNPFLSLQDTFTNRVSSWNGDSVVTSEFVYSKHSCMSEINWKTWFDSIICTWLHNEKIGWFVSITMGFLILTLLWLCLIIVQKFIRRKRNKKIIVSNMCLANDVEKATKISKDMPPPYEDIIAVYLPLSDEGKKKEAEAMGYTITP